MSQADLDLLCERAQRELMRMHYLDAEALLVEAERLARREGNYETLARLYMPLQEVRRQRRQRCGEGVVRLDLIAEGPNDHIRGREVLENYPFGQLLVAGWGTLAPALEVRQLQAELGLYVETFLAAAYGGSDGRLVVIAPLGDTPLPAARDYTLAELRIAAPPEAIVMAARELPAGDRKGTWQTYAETMALWERLHAPFLARADAEADASARIELYRRAISVDYACELAHQKLSDTARELARVKLG